MVGRVRAPSSGWRWGARLLAMVMVATAAGCTPRLPTLPAAFGPTPGASPTAPALALPRPTPAPPPPSVPRAYFYKPPDDHSAADVAGQARFVILTKKDEGFRDDLRAAGYTGLVLQYVLASGAEGPPEARNATAPCDPEYVPFHNQVAYQPGDFCAYLHPNEDWFLHNGAGERLYTAQGGRWIYAMNPASAGWRAFFLSRAQRFLAGDATAPALGYDGLFLDNVELALVRQAGQSANSDGIVREFADDDAYRAAWRGLLTELSAELRPRWPIWANLVAGTGSETDWGDYLPFLDGVMHESFATGWPRAAPPTPAQWEADLRQTETVLAQGKGVIAVAEGADDRLQPFALASFLLLGGGGPRYFRYARGADYDRWHIFANEQVALGLPRGPRYRLADGSWRRDFERGYVVADPAARAGRIVAR